MVGKIVRITVYDHTHDYKVGDLCEVVEASGFAGNYWTLKRLSDGYRQIVCENQFIVEEN